MQDKRSRLVDTDGEDLGRVHDALIVQDGPVGANGRAGLQLHALAVGRRSLGSQLGYVQGTVRGPWMVRRLLHRPPRLVPWNAVVRRDRHQIVVDLSLATEQV